MKDCDSLRGGELGGHLRVCSPQYLTHFDG